MGRLLSSELIGGNLTDTVILNFEIDRNRVVVLVVRCWIQHSRQMGSQFVHMPSTLSTLRHNRLRSRISNVSCLVSMQATRSQTRAKYPLLASLA